MRWTSPGGFETLPGMIRALLSALSIIPRFFARPLLWLSRWRARKKRKWVELRLEGAIVETAREKTLRDRLLERVSGRSEHPQVNLRRLRELTEALEADPHTPGLLVRLGPLEGGWASVQAVRDCLLRVREAGLKLKIHAQPGLQNRELFLASAASELSLQPSGGFGATGTAAIGNFLKDGLSTLGLRVEAISAGRYKSAPDQLTRRGRSAADQDQVEAIVRGLDEALIQALIEGRGLTRAQAEALLDAAPMTAERAQEAGGVDRVCSDEALAAMLPEHPEEAAEEEEAPALWPRHALRSEGGDKAAARVIGPQRYLARERPRPLLRPRGRAVGVVRVHGPIVDAPMGGLQRGPAAVASQVVAALRAAGSNPKIGAVVLHVDSRGGSVTASEAIYSAVRRLDLDKPVVACLGDVAASGGYFVACGARKIVAAPLTVTGSIGVFAMLPRWDGLRRRARIGHDVIALRENAAIYDPWVELSEGSRAHLQGQVDAMYETFLARVSSARPLSRDAVDAVAQGRVWLGQAAFEAKLVDHLDDLAGAVRLAAQLADGPRVRPEAVWVKSGGPQARPPAVAALLSQLPLLTGSGAEGADPLWELLALAQQPQAGLQFYAYAPLSID